MELCSFGCGQEAVIQFKSGNYCCSQSTSKCPKQREKNSKSHQGRFTGIQAWKIPGFKHISWSKGLTKETDDRIAALSRKLTGRPGGKGIAGTPEKEILRKQRISETMRKNPKSGGLREGSGRGKKCWYESPTAGRVYLRSSYELEYVKWLDENDIKWKGNLVKFPYEYEGKIRYYYPDFYLIDSEEYVEIKGYRTSQDEAKWMNFPYKLKVLFKNDLLNLGLNISKY